MRPIAADVAWSVCLLIATMSCAKMAEPIQMLFWVWTSGVIKSSTSFGWDKNGNVTSAGGPKKPCIRERPRSPKGGGNIGRI